MAAVSNLRLLITAASADLSRTPSPKPVLPDSRLHRKPNWGLARCLLGNVASKPCAGLRRGDMVVVGARRPGKNRNGGVVEAVEPVEPTEVSVSREPNDMFMGRKIEGLEPDFFEGEKWDTFGFIIQYLWAFGILVSLAACGVSVATYNRGAVDIRETAVFKEAMENEGPNSSEAENLQDPFESLDAPRLQ